MHPFENLSVAPGSVGIHWFGQSSFAIKHPDGAIIQIDPFYPRDRPSERYAHARPPLHEASLRTDFILLTHNHRDHTCCESIARILAAFPESGVLGPAESAHAIKSAGIAVKNFTIMTGGGASTMGMTGVRAVWAKPPRGIPGDEIAAPDVEHLGYVLDVGGLNVYVSGDPVHTFADHEELLAPVRALHPQLGLLTTHPTEGEFPFFAGSAAMARKLGLRTAVPAHYACFVRRTYDPRAWAAHLVDVAPLIIAYNQSVIYR